MKESTIIGGFKKIEKRVDNMENVTSQHLKQVYGLQASISVTLDAIVKMLIDKGMISMEDVQTYIKKEHEKRMEKATEKTKEELKSQPIIETDSEIPSNDGGEDGE